MNALKKPVFAVIICLILIFVSGVLSTRIRVNNLIDKCSSIEEQTKVITEIKEYSAKFPGNVFISCAGIELN